MSRVWLVVVFASVCRLFCLSLLADEVFSLSTLKNKAYGNHEDGINEQAIDFGNFEFSELEADPEPVPVPEHEHKHEQPPNFKKQVHLLTRGIVCMKSRDNLYVETISYDVTTIPKDGEFVLNNVILNVPILPLCKKGYSRAAIGSFMDRVELTGWGELFLEGGATMDKTNNFQNNEKDDNFRRKLQDSDFAFAIGYLEGWLTHQRLNLQFESSDVIQKDRPAEMRTESRQYLLENMEFARNLLNNRSAQAEDYTRSKMLDASELSEEDADRYYKSVDAVVSQFEGIATGFAHKTNNNISQVMEFLILGNGINEADDLDKIFKHKAEQRQQKQKVNQNSSINSKSDNNSLNLTVEEREALRIEELSMLSCSGFVRLLPDYSDLYLAHATWRGYGGMIRVWKSYKLHLSFLDKPYLQSFSSTYGAISSHDDFYITQNKLSIIETTNNLFDIEYQAKYIKPQSLITWTRSNAANMAATNARQWADMYAKHNCGLYPNQWIVVDYNLFNDAKMKHSSHQLHHRNHYRRSRGDYDNNNNSTNSEGSDDDNIEFKFKLPANTLVVTEQLPDKSVTFDMTDHLVQKLYWPSYNIPAFKEVYEKSGYPMKFKELGNEYSYEECPRAQIFKRELPMVTDLFTAKRLIRLNDWETDPLSLGNPRNAIAARYDLVQPTNLQKMFGAVDGKIASNDLIHNCNSDFRCSFNSDAAYTNAHIVSGPTTQNQPRFCWKDEKSAGSSPQCYDFEWFVVKSLSVY